MLLQEGGKACQSLRPVKIIPDYTKHAEGCALIECGSTWVICTASVEERVPPFLRGKDQGWVTAEYGMLPRSTQSRMIRESSRGKQSGRTQEISRLIGRSLRSIVDLTQLPEKTIWLDCDVVQADGGTRTTSITGACVAMVLAVHKLLEAGVIEKSPLLDFVAAVSVGIVDGQHCLDLCYEEDVNAEVDMNVVMTGEQKFVEVQGTAEGKPFSREDLDDLLEMARGGISDLVGIQRSLLESHVGDLSHLLPHEAIAQPAITGNKK